MKKFIFSISFLFLLITACEVTPQYDAIQGETMGTYFKISYQSHEDITKDDVSQAVDSILFVVNDEMSTYIDSSFISKFNQSGVSRLSVPSNFERVFNSAQDVYKLSDGRFDPTVMPLANFWGFGYTGKVAREQWDSTEVANIVAYVGMDKLKLVDGYLTKPNANFKLDFSAIAKGYASDLIVKHFESIGIDNFLIDIGGDGYAQGKNKKGNPWRIGINIPDKDAPVNSILELVELDGAGLATSGNYRNYYEVKGESYGHTINAKTGFPYKGNVLSASIIAPTAMRADALATASMASPLEEGLSMIEQIPDTEAYLIYIDDAGNMKQKYTSGFKDYILE